MPELRRIVIGMLSCVAVVLFASLMTRTAGDPQSDNPLPTSLPAFEESLLGNDVPSALSSFTQVRMRGEFGAARDASSDNDASVGVVLTGRVGAAAQLPDGQVAVVLGDGGRVGSESPWPALVSRPPVPTLWRAELTMDVNVLGHGATFSVGRFPLALGDGRLVGEESFDARGRSYDGARLDVRLGPVSSRSGAIWISTVDVVDPALQRPAGFVFIELRSQDFDVPPASLHFDAALPHEPGLRASALAMIHRDGAAELTIPTLGIHADAHAPLDVVRFDARLGLDVQTSLPDGDALLIPRGAAARGVVETRLTASAPTLMPASPKPFIGLAGEITAGDATKGRVLRAPGPVQHGVLGLLDLVASDNTWSSAVSIGAADDDGLFFAMSARIIGIVNPRGLLLDTNGVPLPMRAGGGIAATELDTVLSLPLGPGLTLGVTYGVATPPSSRVGDQPAQRLLVSLAGLAQDRPSPSASSSSHLRPLPVF